jgi:multidrug efflux pump subunit AcrA (membrane-fusion protein)
MIGEASMLVSNIDRRRSTAGPRTRLRSGLGAALVLALASSASAQSGPVGSAGMAVSVVRAKSACFSDTVRLTGMVVAREESQVRPDMDGLRITQVLAETGDTVAAGQVLARFARPDNQPNLPASSLVVQAPVAGIVAKSMAQVGALAAIAAPPLFQIVIGGVLEFQAEIPSTRITKIALDQPARMNIAGVGQISGRVRTVSPEISPATQAGQTRISLDTDQRLRVGTFGRASVEVGSSCGVSVPLSSILYSPAGTVIQVVRDNRVETRPVPIGLMAGGNVELRQGVNEGDLVVKRAGSFLREGDRVRPFVDEGAKK